MGEVQIYLGVALAGLVSFLSPCVLPLVPPYLGFLGGTTLDMMTGKEGDRAVYRRVILASLAFVLGFTTVFVSLGASASFIGQVLLQHRTMLSMLAGAIIIVFGLQFLGLVRIPMLYREARYHVGSAPTSLAGAYLIGLAFAFGWTPCIGPILAAVLTAAASEASLGRGISLLFAYSLGLGVPFLLAAIAIRPFMSFMNKFRRHLGTLEKVMGAALVIAGVMFLTGSINGFGQYLLDTFPALARIEEMVTPKGLGEQITKGGG